MEPIVLSIVEERQNKKIKEMIAAAMQKEYPQQAEVVYITRQECDDLRRFNVRMRDSLEGFLKVSGTVPFDHQKLLVQCSAAAMLLGEQIAAGFK